MPRSLYKQGVRYPLNPENSEFSHSLGHKRTSCLLMERFAMGYGLEIRLLLREHAVPPIQRSRLLELGVGSLSLTPHDSLTKGAKCHIGYVCIQEVLSITR